MEVRLLAARGRVLALAWLHRPTFLLLDGVGSSVMGWWFHPLIGIGFFLAMIVLIFVCGVVREVLPEEHRHLALVCPAVIALLVLFDLAPWTNLYVCHYKSDNGLIVELGVKREPSTGFAVSISVDGPIGSWFTRPGSPLTEGVLESGSSGFRGEVNPYKTSLRGGVLTVSVQEPSITKHQSVYIHLISDRQLTLNGVSFADSWNAAIPRQVSVPEFERINGRCHAP